MSRKRSLTYSEWVGGWVEGPLTSSSSSFRSYTLMALSRGPAFFLSFSRCFSASSRSLTLFVWGEVGKWVGGWVNEWVGGWVALFLSSSRCLSASSRSLTLWVGGGRWVGGWAGDENEKVAGG